MSAAEIFTASPPATKPKPAIALVVTPNLVRLRHDQLQASPLNPRKHKPSPEQIEELAESIASRGILQNLVARPLKGSKDKYELAAGETRWRSVAKLIADKRATAGYLMPVSVRELADEDVIEIGLVENGRRNDLHPLDEARAFHALYTARMKDGRKAIGDVVNGLAQKIGKSVRYVQKRLAVARNLAPKATEYLEQGAVNVHVATTLAARTLDEQKRFFAENGKERVSRMTAKEVAEFFAARWRALDDAIFDVAAYKGPIEEHEGERFATDRALFDRLQKEAAEKIAAECRAAVKARKIAFFHEADWLSSHSYEVHKVKGKPDPAGGVVLVHRKHEGTYQVHRGLRMSKWLIQQQRDNARYKASAAARATPARRTDPRMKLAAAQLAGDTKALMAIELHNTFARWDGSITWINIGGYLGDKHRGPVVDALKKLGKFEGLKGAAALKWLLSKSRAELEPAWCALQTARVRINPITRPTQSDLVVFDHCGVKAPTNAKTAGAKLTASKSKPTKNKKGKKS